METFIPYLGVTLLGGLLAHLLRLPALIGFLGAGFALAALGVPSFEGLDEIADLGVTLMLFTIGLKFDVRTLLRREVWSAGLSHIAISTIISFGLFSLLAMAGVALFHTGDLATMAVLGFALSFSSTVVCIKVLEERNDLGALYGQTAIGILVIQDLAAVLFMTLAHGEPPSPWAFALLGVLPLAWLVRKVMDRLDQPELVVLLGMGLAVIAGYWAFEAVGLMGDLGALVMGMLLASHPKSAAMSKSLFGVKELFLVGFFVSIGAAGLPTLEDLAIAALIVVVLTPPQIVLYAVVLRAFRLRNRTSVLAALILGNFSEFAIIVAALGAKQGFLEHRWVTVLSLAVAMSFVIATFLNRPDMTLVDRIVPRIPKQPPERLSPRDRLVDVGRANAIVIGMGRIGRAAYDRLSDEYGWRVLGIENNHARVEELTAAGYKVLEGDGSDAEFWARVRSAHTVEMALLAMPHHHSNEYAFEHLVKAGFEGRTAVVVQRDEDAAAMQERGASQILHLYEGAGIELADHAVRTLRADDELEDPTPTGALPTAPEPGEAAHGWIDGDDVGGGADAEAGADGDGDGAHAADAVEEEAEAPVERGVEVIDGRDPAAARPVFRETDEPADEMRL
ncbi:Glutathione-regulated potassium-efflux system protein KefC [Pseudoclavibacter triregionum]|nr:Glutathione-regulated potassium-efflux system protein KefC [Pseudoclavibacter triregionum]